MGRGWEGGGQGEKAKWEMREPGTLQATLQAGSRFPLAGDGIWRDFLSRSRGF